MSNEVKELLALIGERYVKGQLLTISKEFDKETMQWIYSIPGEPRKLIVDHDGSIGWFNADGPEA